jgi:uncharacterized protein (DUF427 family)
MQPIRRIEPGPGQESVLDYPRPPRLERTASRLRVELGGVVVADTVDGWRVLETYHPPVYYIPPDDVVTAYLRDAGGGSYCEWKGTARYFDVAVGDDVRRHAAWSYPSPSPRFLAIRDHLAFYAGRVDLCTVDGERVEAQPGGFYGGWITRAVVGPFKGGPGTLGW